MPHRGGRSLRRVSDVLLAAGADEIDAIEGSLQALAREVTSARAAASHAAAVAEQREHEYATLIAEVLVSADKHLDDTRMPLHILLTAQFGELNDNQEEMLGAAAAELEVLGRELQRLRLIADIDRGKLTVVNESIHVGDMLRSLHPMLQAQAAAAGVRFTFDIEPALPRVLGDTSRLRDALRLVLTDAVRYAVPGSAVIVHVSSTAAQVVIAVDHGMSHAYIGSALLAQRLIAVQGGTVDEVNGRTTIRLQR